MDVPDTGERFGIRMPAYCPHAVLTAAVCCTDLPGGQARPPWLYFSETFSPYPPKRLTKNVPTPIVNLKTRLGRHAFHTPVISFLRNVRGDGPYAPPALRAESSGVFPHAAGLCAGVRSGGFHPSPAASSLIRPLGSKRHRGFPAGRLKSGPSDAPSPSRPSSPRCRFSLPCPGRFSPRKPSYSEPSGDPGHVALFSRSSRVPFLNPFHSLCVWSVLSTR